MVGKVYLHDKQTNERYALNGDLPTDRKPEDESLSRDFTEHMVIPQSDLPPKVDLRPWMTKVEDQRKLNSCTANAIAGAYEYLYNKATNKKIDVSRLFVYYNSRVKGLRPGEQLRDRGSRIDYALETMHDIGVCLEDMWKYEEHQVNDEPDPDCYDAAQEHLIVEALEVDLLLDEMKTCLAQGFPIVVSINCYSSFNQAKRGGVVPMPRWNETNQREHPRHAVLVVGYSDASQAFIVRNSWGEEWGDKGYCYIPYDYLTNKRLTNYAYTVKKLNVESFDEVGWCRIDGINYMNQQEGEQFDGAAAAEEPEEDDAEIEVVDEDADDTDY